MPHPRFSLRSLVVLVALAAILLAGWRTLDFYRQKRFALTWCDGPVANGNILVAISVDNEPSAVLKDTVHLVSSKMPIQDPKDGDSKFYDPVVRSGSARVVRAATRFTDLRLLCDDLDTAITTHFDTQGLTPKIEFYVMNDDYVLYAPHGD